MKKGASPLSSGGTWLLVIGVAAGLLLVFFGSGIGRSDGGAAAGSAEMSAEEDDARLAALEYRVKQLLEAMDGVSDVVLVLTPDTGSELRYAQNLRYGNGIAEEKSTALSGSGSDSSPIPIGLIYPRVRGAAVVCRGGSNPVTQEKILSLLCALLDLPASRVYVTG